MCCVIPGKDASPIMTVVCLTQTYHESPTDTQDIYMITPWGTHRNSSEGTVGLDHNISLSSASVGQKSCRLSVLQYVPGNKHTVYNGMYSAVVGYCPFIVYTSVFKISAGPQTLTGKIWVGPASFPSLSYINIYKFWQNCASVCQVSDLILKTDTYNVKNYKKYLQVQCTS